MTPEEARARHALATMPKEAPERCLFVEHWWSGWTLFEQEPPVLMPRPSDDVEPCHETVRAWRYRGCRQCGAEQRQAYGSGDIELIRDPHRIEQRRGGANHDDA